MDYSITLEISEEAYKPLRQAAQQKGQSLEVFAAKWLEVVAYTVQDDPIEEFIGGFSSDFPNWTEQTDALLGEVLLRKMNSSDETNKIHA